jgi:hypothetical protein
MRKPLWLLVHFDEFEEYAIFLDLRELLILFLNSGDLSHRAMLKTKRACCVLGRKSYLTVFLFSIHKLLYQPLLLFLSLSFLLCLFRAVETSETLLTLA